MKLYDSIIAQTGAYYTTKLLTHGSTSRGVDWNSTESQRLRFEQLLKVRAPTGPRSILDYGCGYGALLKELRGRGEDCRYQGFDISPAMVDEALRLHPDASFTTDRSTLEIADYTVASGIFNVKLGTHEETWKAYMLDRLDDLDRLSRRGFAFNILTRYGDPDRRRQDLYYADPCFYFDLCKNRYARDVALLHDYGLYEFTILVRKGS
jgi:SAM-dependent methyltransferase